MFHDSSMTFMVSSFNEIPDDMVVIFTDHGAAISKEETEALFGRPSSKRDWFSSHFYKCLPLVIANQYGFEIKTPYAMSFIWNGESNNSAISWNVFNSKEELHGKQPEVRSHFGHGIITYALPWTLKTPKGVNLMIMPPPNIIIPNITVMTGVVETDNLDRHFTLNLKIQEPNKLVHIPKGQPIATLLPIPRYFQDKFKLQFAEDIMSQDELTRMDTFTEKEYELRQQEYEPPNKPGMRYFKGLDAFGEPFEDHQGPKIKYQP
jgi:hypothetical protein